MHECFDSILKQSYQNWEVLAVDDHSTDGSAGILREYAQKDPRFRIFTNSGSGIIPALRLAYEHTEGSLITRMDSDDIMTPDKLSAMVRSLQTLGNGHLAIGQVRYFSDRGISDGYARYELWLNKLTASGKNFTEIYKECVVPSPCWMAYREDLDDCGAFTPDRYPEDYDLTFRFYEKGLKCIPSDQVLHLWRDYDSRTSRTSEHYAQNYFLDIKLYYFLKLDRDRDKPLAIWGAGSKGKTIAKTLVSLDISFIWLCDNPKKIGKKIYGQELLHYHKLKDYGNAQSIVTVANETAQQMITAYMEKLGFSSMSDYFFFC